MASEELALIPEDAQEREDVIEARQRPRLLRGAIAELPERTRRIFVLHRLEELTYAEIAQRLGIPGEFGAEASGQGAAPRDAPGPWPIVRGA